MSFLKKYMSFLRPESLTLEKTQKRSVNFNKMRIFVKKLKVPLTFVCPNS